MRAKIKLRLAFVFFKGPLFSYFILFGFVVFCILSLFFIVNGYEQQVENRFASKQPHFTLTLSGDIDQWQVFKQTAQMKALKKVLSDQENIVAVSEFARVTKWLRLKAATSQLSGFETQQEYDKFSSGNVTLLALERKLPSVIPMTQLNYYDAGAYKFKITNLEYAADWLVTPRLVLPNAVLDASFYTPIGQQVSVKSDSFEEPFQIKAFINDYADASILYMGLEQLPFWITKDDSLEAGLFVRIEASHRLEETKDLLLTLLARTGKDWLVTTWLEEKSKQKSILLMTKLLGYSLIVILVVMLLFVLALNQSTVFINKAKSLKILFMTGYLLTTPLIITGLIASALGGGVAYLLVFTWVKPAVSTIFNVTAPLEESLALIICSITFILINLFNFLGMKNRMSNE